MARPTLTASPQGIQLAKQTLLEKGWTQNHLRQIVDCSRQPITNFFKAEPIAQSIFIKICDGLGLDWKVVAGIARPSIVSTPAAYENFPESSASISTDAAPGLTAQSATEIAIAALAEANFAEADLADLVQDLRRQVHDEIQLHCGTMRILDMSYPVGIEDIYTDVNILEQITGRRRKRLDELLQQCNAENFDRLGLGQISEERVSGIEAVQKYRRLIILGKPGAGKTTFLKHLAIQCNQGQFECDRLPVFVTLKDFAEEPDQPSLLDYVSRRSASVSAEEAAFLRVFQQGQALILLDGLDEVRADDHHRILREIRQFSEQFYDNHFVITCRIAAWEYTFDKFTEVEVADFDEAQIAAFAAKWFSQKIVSAAMFLRALNHNPQIHQLAVSPLLLTLLCLTFEESGEFPASRSELYKEGIDALLKKWDAKRGIQRDQVYKKLSLQHKQDLLSHIALLTFKNQEYFFKQAVLEEYIRDYIADLPNAEADLESLQLDSEAVLRSIEAQHGLLVERAKGIYSFSHLTFQEYFAAREIVFNAAHLQQTLQELLTHLVDPRWREIFLMATELLRDASVLLKPMKEQIDQLFAHQPKLQQFLQYVRNSAAAPEFADFKPVAARAFCFDIDFEIDKERTIALLADPTTTQLVCASFFTRTLQNTTLPQAIAIVQNYEATASEDQKISAAKSANEAMRIGIHVVLTLDNIKPGLRPILEKLVQREEQTLGNEAQQDEEELEQLADDARKIAKDNLNHIGSDAWKLANHPFSDVEKELLRQYYAANELLLRCLKSEGCRMKREIRQVLEEALFLPA